MLQLERWTHSRPPIATVLPASAAPQLQEARRRLFRAARAFTSLDAERRHRVRVLAKRLRYALDLYSVVLPADETARYVEALADLQDSLGTLNDLAVAESVLPTLTRSKALVAEVTRKLRARETELVEEAGSRCTRVAHMPLPVDVAAAVERPVSAAAARRRRR
jgi:CHAD domain-containing protein